MSEIVDLKCPKCGFTFGLTDALIQPVIIAAVQAELEKERENIWQQAQARAGGGYAAKLLAAEQEIAEKSARLAEAEKAELQARKERRAAEEAMDKIELEVERRLDERCAVIRETAKRETEELHRLELAERDKLIADLKKNIEDLHHRGEQTSIQLKGETLEISLEAMLRAAFPGDCIEPVPNGRSGGDLVQCVIGPNGMRCGTILWEFKAVKNWSTDWLEKCRDDQRKSGAHLAVIVTTAMPKDVQTFERIDGGLGEQYSVHAPSRQSASYSHHRTLEGDDSDAGSRRENRSCLQLRHGPAIPCTRGRDRRSVWGHARGLGERKAFLNAALGKALQTPGVADLCHGRHVRRFSGNCGQVTARSRGAYGASGKRR